MDRNQESRDRRDTDPRFDFRDGVPMEGRGRGFTDFPGSGFPFGFYGMGGPPGGPGREFRELFGTRGRGDGHRGRGFHCGGRGRGMYGPRGGHWGHRFGGPMHWMDDSSSDSSTDSESDHKKKKQCVRKESKKCQKQMKSGHRMRQWMANQSCNKSQCTSCWRQIKPLMDTEVLECGHIYHRLCLKEYFQLSITDEQKDVQCVQCKQPIDGKLVDELQKRFPTETSDDKTISKEPIAKDIENMTVIE